MYFPIGSDHHALVIKEGFSRRKLAWIAKIAMKPWGLKRRSVKWFRVAIAALSVMIINGIMTGFIVNIIDKVTAANINLIISLICIIVAAAAGTHAHRLFFTHDLTRSLTYRHLIVTSFSYSYGRVLPHEFWAKPRENLRARQVYARIFGHKQLIEDDWQANRLVYDRESANKRAEARGRIINYMEQQLRRELDYLNPEYFQMLRNEVRAELERSHKSFGPHSRRLTGVRTGWSLRHRGIA